MIAQHEQQHDETMLATHQLRRGPAVLDAPAPPPAPADAAGLPREVLVPAGPFTQGTSTDPWALDNERPAHRVQLAAFLLDTAPVTNAAYQEFIADGGYHEPRWWTPEGWEHRRQAGLIAPLFWRRDGEGWLRLRFGRESRSPATNRCVHVCWYEADAYARWAGRRLPTEAEWEKAARHDPAADRSLRHPWGDARPGTAPRQPRPAPPPARPGRQLPGRGRALRCPATARRRLGVDLHRLRPLPGLHGLPLPGVLGGLLRPGVQGPARRLVRRRPGGLPGDLPQLGLPDPAADLRRLPHRPRRGPRRVRLMCRHLAYLGPPTTLGEVLLAPAHSLFRQSWAPRRQRHGTVNADGFGIGWYPPVADQAVADQAVADQAAADEAATEHEDPLPARYRRALPIWADPDLPDLARTLRSHAFLAAVRSATGGTAREATAAAPFREDRWLFSHNGVVRDWTRLPLDGTGLEPADLLGLEAHVDSALLWALVARRLRQGEPAGLALAGVVRRVAEARPQARLNLLLTDGGTIAATRHGDTLWYRTAPGQVLVASEPDHADLDAASAPGSDDWQEVPDHSLLLASPGSVRIVPLRAPAARPRPLPPYRPNENGPHRMNDRFTLQRHLPADFFAATLRADVLQGLAEPPRTLPPKWFYDERGSRLFEEITRLPEYYPTRAEQEILTRRAPDIARATRARSLVELGSGSSRKTRLLLNALTAAGTLQRYTPLDVSDSALTEAGEALGRDYPSLRISAVVTDFEHDLALTDEPGPRLVAFLGGTLGNLDTAGRAAFYAALRRTLSADDTLLLGADLVKDPAVLVAAYDDSQGVTAAFNKNVLNVLNRELDAGFDPEAFDHLAVWNAAEERIEMRLRSRAHQLVPVKALDLELDLDAGEEIRTEISVKFRREGLTAELDAAGFTVRHWWTDAAGRFALLLAVPSR